jgi:hypothetical protein
LEVFKKNVPEKTKLVEMMMDTLFLEKGAVYRRLQGEVPFSFLEVVNIAEKLNICLSELACINSSQTGSFELNIVDYSDMDEPDYKNWEDYLSLTGFAKNDPHSELVESSNVLPISLYGGYDSLSKFFLFKCLFFDTENRILYSDLKVPDRLRKIHQSYYIESRNFAKTVFIWDYLIFQYLVTDLKFFYGIKLISADDLQKIKQDLFVLLDYVEEIALNGCFEETGNPVSFYISDINLDADYCYVKLNGMHISHVRSFILNSLASINPSSFKKIQNWIHSLKKSSTLITQSGAAYRADFFEKQRMIISELNAG